MEDLEDHGFIYTMVGRGCYVSDFDKKGLNSIKLELVEKKIMKNIDCFKELGLSKEKIINVIEKYYK